MIDTGIQNTYRNMWVCFLYQFLQGVAIIGFETGLAFLALVRRISRDVRKDLNFELSGPQVQLLESLTREGPLRMSDLADRLDVTLGAMTALADRMVKSGLIERVRSSADRRVVHLVITNKGRQLHDSLARARNQILEVYFGSLSADERATLAHLLNKMLEHSE